ncbi:hypothetical protein GON03_19050 [Nocardioides sp. MAH-18]|uniref:Uncharacterized protein n=1 Tax=Nocardioides agri TaxID=2682843 RepID=A0A6L6XV72_9ACTN|nr:MULTISPECIES: DUF6093 family protein [unclassified Nocardioides]MBA2952115.1 hypothetical protein [Nocardioides sp. CGMCC 1.13656]MVQ51284.1 hypothetical protein [Nocardioides sp. MAH-18]
MLRQHTGRPGSPVIHPDWQTAPQSISAATGTAACTIRHPGTTQTWSDAAQENVAVPNPPYYAGTCRVEELDTQARQILAADDPETIARYSVTIPATELGAINDLVNVTGSGDQLLDGQTLKVVSIELGSLRFERVLYCVLNS